MIKRDVRNIMIYLWMYMYGSADVGERGRVKLWGGVCGHNINYTHIQSSAPPPKKKKKKKKKLCFHIFQTENHTIETNMSIII